MEINVREYLGENFSIEDAILLREAIIKNNMENITLDFAGIKNVPATFFNCLFGPILYEISRKEIFSRIDVKNLSNINDYSRVVLGTAFAS
ncbi:STAS-like domain-containing protein [Clostridium sp. SHJSY1]|uniref:STAS-like domain-containing protein n=1 Tax=Clostridium sp. SHJSY1 TaxID=2942483 RepID=UPI0028743E8C|nr:STAS-like domain-containing protein [Clostridium sp. SHJSY1]MDS0525369.1 STAS-like domain-containing protein [Clostridium sp. SHJSY1]